MMQRRSDGPILDPNIVFPPLQRFHQPNKLPTKRSVISVLRFLTEDKWTHSDAIAEVAKQVYAKWYHDTVYCVTIRSVRRKVKTMWEIFWEGKRRISEVTKKEHKAMKDYSKLVSEAEEMFDIFSETDPNNWGVKMTKRERTYYEDMKKDREMECDHGVDPVWYAAMMKKQRSREKSEEYKKKQQEQFATVDLDKISDLLNEDGGLVSSEEEDDSNSEVEEEVQAQENEIRGECSSHPKNKKRKFEKVSQSKNLSDIPVRYRHLRDSERNVRDEVYKTIADLLGAGLSINEATKAIILVGKGMFDLEWKSHEQDEETFDVNTMPHYRNIHDKIKLIEAQSLSLVVDEMVLRSSEGRMLTHAIDSTTKRRVGTFACQGIHVGQNVPLPLPLLPICGETTEDIAHQTDFAFEILEAVTGKRKEDIYKLINAHITDTTDHNKGFASILAELYNLDTAAGQLFCGTHTTLGFSSAMCKMVSIVEKDMKLENIFSHFMVSIEADSKHDCFAAQALDMMLKLVAPEYSNKQWNYNKAFLDFLEKHDVASVLFAYKDHRFGCLSRAAGVLLYNYESLEEYLSENPQISNRLACLVRDVLDLPYLKVIFTVFAALGIHLIEPFYCKTIETGTTHSKLKSFYKQLYADMEEPVSESFFSFDEPQFSAVEANLFEGVKESYNESVVEAVITASQENGDQCVKLANFIIPELRTVLARQRRDYGISEEFPAQYPVEMQASNVDDTPVNNLSMERTLGTSDYRLPKLRTLEAVSKSIVLSKTAELRGKTDVSFRSFRKEAEKKKEINLKWSEKMKEKFKKGIDEKMVKGEVKERKRLAMLEELKKHGGPCTSAEQVEDLVKKHSHDDASQELLTKRLKMEMKFARDSSTTLPKVDPIFRIQVTLPNKVGYEMLLF